MNLRCICENYNSKSESFSFSPDDSDMIFCPLCECYQHIKCIQPCHKMKTYICPQCQFHKLDFHLKSVSQILAPSIITPIPKKNTTHKFTFSMNFQDFPSKTGRFFYLLIVRCLKLTDKGYSVEWPINALIKINKSQIKVNNVANCPLYFSIIEHLNDKLKTHYPYHLIKDCFTDEGNDKPNNTLILYINNKDNSHNEPNQNSYVITIEYVSVDLSIKKIKESIPKLNNQSDICIMLSKGNSMLSNETVELMDMFYTMTGYIGIPARGIDCAHFTCFDLDKFLHLAKTSKSPVKYHCPICKQPCNMLYIDEVMMELIKKGKEMNKKKVVLDNNMNVIEFVEDNDEMECERGGKDGKGYSKENDDNEEEDEDYDEIALMNEFNNACVNEGWGNGSNNYLDKGFMNSNEKDIHIIQDLFGNYIRNINFIYEKEINGLIECISNEINREPQLTSHDSNNNNNTNSNSSPTSSSSIININII